MNAVTIKASAASSTTAVTWRTVEAPNSKMPTMITSSSVVMRAIYAISR